MANDCHNRLFISSKNKRFINNFSKFGFEIIGKYEKNDDGLYEWNIKHYGTKWNIKQENIKIIKEKNNIIFNFYTSCFAPINFCINASRKYNIKIDLYYISLCGFDIDYIGILEVKNGNILTDYFYESFDEIDNLDFINKWYGNKKNLFETYYHNNFIIPKEMGLEENITLYDFENFKQKINSLPLYPTKK